MISFELTEEQKLAQSMVQQLAANTLRPLARSADDRESIPASLLEHIWSTGIIQSQASADSDAAHQIGHPERDSARGTPVADASFAIATAAPLGFVNAIASQGSAAQKKALLPLFVSDKYRCAGVSIMEPEFAFDVTSLRTAATRTSNGYRLSGTKGLVPLAGRCSHFLVVAQSEGVADAFIVDRDAKGVTVGDKKPVWDSARSKWRV